jgi:hypothetical protein
VGNAANMTKRAHEESVLQESRPSNVHRNGGTCGVCVCVGGEKGEVMRDANVPKRICIKTAYVYVSARVCVYTLVGAYE